MKANNKFDNTQKLYNQYAKQFADKLDQLPETQQLDEFLSMVAKGCSVLDLGCGSGRDAEYLSKNGLVVSGIDLSEGLISEAKTRRPNIDFRAMDIADLQFPDSHFDGVWSKLTILHVDRKDLLIVLQGCLRVLKTGCPLMIETKAGSGEALETISFSENDSRLFVYYELTELKDLLTKAGFVGVDGYEYNIGNQHATHIKDRVVVFGRKP